VISLTRPLPRAALRAGVFGAVLVSSALVASPAFAALHRDDGDDPGKGLGALKVVGIYIGIPIGLFVLIALLVSIPSMIRGPKYRPGKEWQATPEWYGAPGDDPALEGADHAELEAGGEHAELTGTVVEPAAEGDGGGTSARW
jgi:hypothetical protein